MNVQYRNLGLAIDRYSRACTEIVDESIIYFVIVLENLLGKGLGNGELTHRISSRGALLLSSDIDTRKFYYIVFKYLYSLRSALVHGSVDEIKSPTVEQKEALISLGVTLSGKKLDECNDKCAISNFARKLARDVLIYFINHEEQWNKAFLENLELGIGKK
jgi:hypothetical protein